MQPPTAPNWITELAEQERQRRKDHQITRAAAMEFRERLSTQVTSDLQVYFREFPHESQNIQRETESGDAVITRTRDEESVYEGVLCQIRSKIELRKMVIECRFPH